MQSDTVKDSNLRTITHIAGNQHNNEHNHSLNVAGTSNTVTVNDHRVIYVNEREHSVQLQRLIYDYSRSFRELSARLDEIIMKRMIEEQRGNEYSNVPPGVLSSCSRSPIEMIAGDVRIGQQIVSSSHTNAFPSSVTPRPSLAFATQNNDQLAWQDAYTPAIRSSPNGGSRPVPRGHHTDPFPLPALIGASQRPKERCFTTAVTRNVLSEMSTTDEIPPDGRPSNARRASLWDGRMNCAESTLFVMFMVVVTITISSLVGLLFCL